MLSQQSWSAKVVRHVSNALDWIALSALGACSLGVVNVSARGVACAPPPFFVALDAPARDDAPGLMKISIARPQFTLENLVCLVRTFKEDHSSNKGLTILVFDARYAADEFVPSEMALSPQIFQNYKQLLATYVFDPANHDEHVSLSPLGYGRDERFDSRIDLTSDAMPRCRFGLDNRCLFVFDTLDLASEPRLPTFTGSVVLQGSIRPDGNVTGVRVLSARGTSTALLKRVTTAATDHVKAWWFEPAPRENRFRATYQFGPGGPSAHDGSDLALELSNYLTVIVNTSK